VPRLESPVKGRAAVAGWHGLWHRAVVYGLLAILALPPAAALIHSLASAWPAAGLPSGFTLHWYAALWSAPRFLAACGRTLLVCGGALALSVTLVLPLVLAMHCYLPRLRALMNVLMLLPVAVPPVVSSVGLLQLFGQGPAPLIGTPWILIGSYFTLALPFLYRGLDDRLRALDFDTHAMATDSWRALLRVVAPNLRHSIAVALLSSFVVLIGEFAFANILAGSSYETLQVYLNNARDDGGHLSSALLTSYFLFIAALGWVMHRLGAAPKYEGAGHS
jgi:putative spermidine/putrescine transport system permease protein